MHLSRKELIEFFEEKPAIKKSVFAKEAGISRQYLFLILKGERDIKPIAEDLLRVMNKYGG